MPIPALIPAAIGGAQLIGGLVGRFSRKRPKREIPQSSREALGIARLQAGSPYAPGYQQARAGIDIASANAMAAAGASGNAAAAIQGVVGQQQNANRELTAQGLQYQAGAQERLQGALRMMAEEEDRQFQINEFAPYADQMRLSEDMIGAGAINLSSAGNMLFAADQMGLLKFGKSSTTSPSGPGVSTGPLGLSPDKMELIKNLARSIYLP